MEKRFADIPSLLSACLVQDEDPDTASLIANLRHVLETGYFTQSEFLSMCKWKEPRQRLRKHWAINTDAQVRAISAQALHAPDETRRILHLTRLGGVGIPLASAFLMLTDPAGYGVIDVRVWQVLALYGEVDYDKDGRGIFALHWLDYLDKLRSWASKFNVSARAIERTLFQHHQEIQIGRLYP